MVVLCKNLQTLGAAKNDVFANSIALRGYSQIEMRFWDAPLLDYWNAEGNQFQHISKSDFLIFPNFLNQNSHLSKFSKIRFLDLANFQKSDFSIRPGLLKISKAVFLTWPIFQNQISWFGQPSKIRFFCFVKFLEADFLI